MYTSKRELLRILGKIRRLPLLVVGDVMLDRYIWGSVERISPEAPVPVVKVNKNEDRLGGAGNAARNLAALGAKVSVVGFIGADAEGNDLKRLFRQSGIDISGLLVDKTRPTSVKTRVIAHAQQVVRIDREESHEPSAAAKAALCRVLKRKIGAAKAVLISDYGKGAIGKEVFSILAEFRRAGAFGLNKRPLVLDPNPKNRDLYRGITVAKPNRKEAEDASGIRIVDTRSALKAGKKLLSDWQAEMMLISLGEDGLLIVFADSDQGVLLETVAREVHDVSGAGDTVTSLFAAALAAGAKARVAGELANIGAGIVVSEVGTAAVDPKKLRKEIELLTAK